jgi:hypothetical protein
MRMNRMWLALAGLLSVAAVLAWAQVKKPGLWEMTMTQTWQQSPFPPGMGGPNSPFGAGTRTGPVCITQEQIDKYGSAVPRGKDCQLANVVKSEHGMTADLVCAGRISGKGSVEVSGVDDDHFKGKVHFAGSLQLGPSNKPVEWTNEFSGAFKSSDCGSVKPAADSGK